MTRFELSTILSAQTLSRTILAEGEQGEVSDNSEVLFLEVVDNVLIIQCAPSQKKRKLICGATGEPCPMESHNDEYGTDIKPCRTECQIGIEFNKARNGIVLHDE